MRIGRLEHAWAAEDLRPAVGWKVWRVDEEARLHSVLYGDVWPLEEPVRAICKRLAHDVPHQGCECGIHAGRNLAAWEHYLNVNAESRVFGRVLLWGSTLEGAHGWRAAQARPVEIFVPTAVTEQERVAEGLSAYGVPVHRLVVREPVPA
ncbi:MAG TPA: hypothetical protein VI142_07455 [Gaiellaceae bacterium]